jgi:LacI family transcriptional regulator
MKDDNTAESVPKAPTLNDVAALSGFSAQTVSRVINRKGSVSELTRHKVNAAIKQLGYRPNSVARSLVTRKSKAIGLVVTDFAQGFFPDTTRSIEREAALAGYTVHIITATGELDIMKSAIERFRDSQFSGIIVNTSTSGFEADLQRASAEGFPVVLIHRSLPGISSTVVWYGYRRGAELAVDHLVSVGCRRIAFLATENRDRVDLDKLEGYKASLQKASIPFCQNLVIQSPHSFQGGFNAIAEILHAHPDVDGVFVTSDVRAVGCLRALSLIGIDVPNDIAMVAFGGSTMASMVTPSLSTVRVPRSRLGIAAVELLLKVINGEPPQELLVHDQPVLEIAESSIRSLQSTTGLAPRTRKYPL